VNVDYYNDPTERLVKSSLSNSKSSLKFIDVIQIYRIFNHLRDPDDEDDAKYDEIKLK